MKKVKKKFEYKDYPAFIADTGSLRISNFNSVNGEDNCIFFNHSTTNPPEHYGPDHIQCPQLTSTTTMELWIIEDKSEREYVFNYIYDKLNCANNPQSHSFAEDTISIPEFIKD